jgi:hypothetical protein
MNKKLGLAVFFFSIVTLATLAMSILFLHKIYKLTSSKSTVVGLVLVFIIGMVIGVFIHKMKKRTVKPQ